MVGDCRTFRQPVLKPSSESRLDLTLRMASAQVEDEYGSYSDSSLKMASAQVVETSVANNSPSQDSNHADEFFNQGMLLLGSNHAFSYFGVVLECAPHVPYTCFSSFDQSHP